MPQYLFQLYSIWIEFGLIQSQLMIDILMCFGQNFAIRGTSTGEYLSPTFQRLIERLKILTLLYNCIAVNSVI
jgi:hypothetical protein